VGGIESEGIAVSDPGNRDITASHGASPPPAVWKTTRVARLTLRNRSNCGVGASQCITCSIDDISPPITAPPGRHGCQLLGRLWGVVRARADGIQFGVGQRTL
jgi:hypothetical protein